MGIRVPTDKSEIRRLNRKITSLEREITGMRASESQIMTDAILARTALVAIESEINAHVERFTHGLGDCLLRHIKVGLGEQLGETPGK